MANLNRRRWRSREEFEVELERAKTEIQFDLAQLQNEHDTNLQKWRHDRDWETALWRSDTEYDRNRKIDQKEDRHHFDNAILAFGQLSIKSSMILNGGAAVSVLAFASSLINSDEFISGIAVNATDISLTNFVWGVLFASIAAGLSYLAQFCYSMQNQEQWDSQNNILTIYRKERNEARRENKDWPDWPSFPESRKAKFFKYAGITLHILAISSIVLAYCKFYIGIENVSGLIAHVLSVRFGPT